MKHKRIFTFIISVCFSGVMVAQTPLDSLPEVEKRKFPLRLRVGADLFRLIKTQVDPNYRGIELVGDLQITQKLYIAAEIGTENHSLTAENINFTARGNYIRLGADLDLYRNWKGMENNIFIGMRFSNSLHRQRVNRYTLYSTHHYWIERQTRDGYATGERDGLNTNWLEFLAGIKVQLFPNTYACFSFRMHRLMGNTSAENFANLWVPGFNKITDDNRFGGSFNYTLIYRLPLRN
ncbi:MAG: DUF6048 family protein [Flavobacteriaceae bacterium]